MWLFYLVFVIGLMVDVIGYKNCPSGWTFYEPDGTCIKLLSFERTFNDSKRDCFNLYGAVLVEIHDAEKNSFFGEMIRAAGIWTSWIGVYHKIHRTYRLYSGAPLHYQNWLHNTLRKGPDHCVQLHVDQSDNQSVSDRKWTTKECDSSNHFACEKFAYVHPECPRGWSKYETQDKCWYYNPNALSHRLAAKNCRRLGGLLATPASRESDNLLKETSRQRNQGLHIGVWDAYRNGTYINPDGTPLDLFQSWADDFPLNPSSRQHCLEIHADGLWRNIQCGLRRAFVCEKEAKRPSQPDVFRGRCQYNDWMPYPNELKCLRFVNRRTTWHSARRMCQNRNADLVQVFEQNKANVVHELTGRLRSVAIGIHDPYEDGIWQSVNGTIMPLNPLWWYQDSRLGDYRCATLYRYHNRDRLVFKRIDCQSRLPFVCEKPMANSSVYL